jgi:hypothetical protein
MEDHAAEIIPQLLPGAILIDEKNVELKREMLRPDLVYLITYYGEQHILDTELQAAGDDGMLKRLLLYHVELHLTYRRPVISVVLYLFPTTIPEPPYREMSGNKALLTFDYRPIGLWTLDARSYVEQHIISMYTFLPGMHGVTMALLMQAIHEMEQTYDRPHFARHLFRFQRILMQTTMLSAEEKQAVIEQLYPYNSLYDEDPEIQERLARKAIESKIEDRQQMVLDAIQSEFPALFSLASQEIVYVRDMEYLSKLVKMIYQAPSEKAVRWLLMNLPHSNT